MDGGSAEDFGDLGPSLARAFVGRCRAADLEIARADDAIRATVVGAAQYTAQVSGDTIYVAPMEFLPVRNVPVIAPAIDFEQEPIDEGAVAVAVRDALRFLELDRSAEPVAIFVRWRGSATFQRLDAFARGVLMAIGSERPLLLVGDGDIGGLMGIHIRHEIGHPGPIASLDGLDLKPLDHIDVGEILEASGAAPVIIKSLVFPADMRIGRPV